MFTLFVFLGCQESDQQKQVSEIVSVFDSEHVIDLPQTAAEWWEEEDQLSNNLAGAGVLIGDLNMDGALDVVLLRKDGIHMHIRDGDSWFSDSYTDLDFVASSGAIIDWDQDGDTDVLFNTVFGADVIWFNQEGMWVSEALPSPTYAMGNAWYDVNQDGLLDVVTAGYGDDQSEDLFTAFEVGIPYPGEPNSLYLQTPDGHFDRSEVCEIGLDGFTFMPIFLPLLPDEQWNLLTINDFGQVNGPNRLYRIAGDGFEPVESGHGLDVRMHGMGVDATDINGDLIPDLFITDIGRPMFLESVDEGIWSQAALAYGIEFSPDQDVCWGVDWYDVNNDGHEDLWMGCGPLLYQDVDQDSQFADSSTEQPDGLFLWTEDGFVDVAQEWGIDRTSSTRAGGFVDLTDDGCAELIRVPRDGPAEIFEGTCNVQNAWLDIELDDGKSGVGATIVVDDGKRQQVRWMRAGGTSIATFLPQRVHFGFGRAGDLSVDVTVTWDDGTVSEFAQVSTRQRIRLVKE